MHMKMVLEPIEARKSWEPASNVSVIFLNKLMESRNEIQKMTLLARHKTKDLSFPCFD
jgi:hypothetical protein